MPKIHPKLDALRGMWGLLPEARRRVLRHAHECPACRKALESGTAGETGRPLPRLQPSYERILDRVLRSLEPRIRQAERERAQAPALLAELVRFSPGRREMLVRNARRFRSFSLCLLILDRSRDVSPEDPREGEEWALLALHLIDFLTQEVYGRGLIEDVRARAWTFAANSRRIAGNFLGAEQAFERAEEHLRQGTRDRLERAQVLVSKASLRRVQSRFTEAERLLRRALSVWLSAGESRRAVEAMIIWALVYQEHGQPERGIRLLREASELPAAIRDPRLALAIYHNLAVCLVDAGKLLEAQGVLLHNRDLYDRVPGTVLRGRCIEGQLAIELGRTAEAETLLTGARDAFLEQGMVYDAALATIGLAQVSLQAGRAADAGAFAREAFAAFVALRVEKQALACYLLARRAGLTATPLQS